MLRLQQGAQSRAPKASLALNISVNDEGQQVIAQRYAAPAYVELDAGMSATEITIIKARNKTREDGMIAEQNIKRAIMDSVGLAIRHIIAPPPLCFQNMTSIDIIDARQEMEKQAEQAVEESETSTCFYDIQFR